MRVIIKTIADRRHFHPYLRRCLPGAEFCTDEKRCGLDTFARSLEMAGSDPCIHTEDDILVTKDFMAKALAVINERPNLLIQFFSMRKKDLTEGSRLDRNYLMNQCFFAPANYSVFLREFYDKWATPENLEEHRLGPDVVVRDFLRSRREAYWIHCPSLVEHMETKSVLDPRRSSKRQSLTFRDPIPISFSEMREGLSGATSAG
jgi:hypothetical protein